MNSGFRLSSTLLYLLNFLNGPQGHFDGNGRIKEFWHHTFIYLKNCIYLICTSWRFWTHTHTDVAATLFKLMSISITSESFPVPFGGLPVVRMRNMRSTLLTACLSAKHSPVNYSKPCSRLCGSSVERILVITMKTDIHCAGLPSIVITKIRGMSTFQGNELILVYDFMVSVHGHRVPLHLTQCNDLILFH